MSENIPLFILFLLKFFGHLTDILVTLFFFIQFWNRQLNEWQFKICWGNVHLIHSWFIPQLLPNIVKIADFERLYTNRLPNDFRNRLP